MIAGFGVTVWNLGLALGVEGIVSQLVGIRPEVQAATLGAARCPVCSHAVRGRTVVCRKCDIPTHEDCWKFQGGCGIFGCQSQYGLAINVLPDQVRIPV
jgi:hypothetical protein